MLKRLLGPNPRYVLIIGNAGAVLSYVADGRVRGKWTVTDFGDAAVERLTNAIEERRRVPVIVLIDMLEQSYRRTAIPPVGPAARRRVIRRRLNIDYPSDEIKAALPLGEKIGPRGDPVYLFVALPSSPELENWIAFLHSISNPIASLAMLPIESASLADALARAITRPDAGKGKKGKKGETGEKGEKGEWTLLISHQQTGGFRQIVVRRGRLAMTRLTPDSSEGSETAGVIAQELSSTLGYLTRLGYTESDGLDVIVIGPRSLRETLDRSQLPVRSVTVLTPTEAGALLELTNVVDPAGDFGELLYAAWAAGRRKPTVNLAATALGQRQVQVAAARKWVVPALSMSAIMLAAYCGNTVADLWPLRQDVTLASTILEQLQGRLNQMKLEIEQYPDRPKKITISLDIHTRLVAETVDPLPMLRAIGESLGPGHHLKRLIWKTEDARVATTRQVTSGVSQPDSESSPTLGIILTLDLSSVTDPERAIAEANALADRLQQRFTEQRVEVVRPPLDILPSQTFVGSSSEDVPLGSVGELSAEILIKGPAG